MATWSGPVWSKPTWAGADEASPLLGEPVTPGSIQLVLRSAGPIGLVDPGAYKPIMPGSIRLVLRAPGPNPPIDPLDLRPIRPGSIRLELSSSGPQVLPPAVDDPAAPTPVPGYSVPAMTVVGASAPVLEAEANPALNEVGGGNVVTEDAVPSDTIVGVNVAGVRIFTGFAGQIIDTQIAEGEELEQTVSTELIGLLDEWRHTLVLPDFGARDVRRIGQPIQDTRYFDWRMLGIDPVNAVGGTSSQDPITEALRETHTKALPDPWPDPQSRWMWAGGSGWRHFRVSVGESTTTTQIWCCAYDYAEVYMDGVQILECSQAGQPEVKLIDTSDGDSVTNQGHLIAIRAFGNAYGGVQFSMMPMGAFGLYGAPIMNSRSGWKVIANTDKLCFNVGQVLARLMDEATKRKATASRWRLTCNAKTDSAGRAWPKLTEPITLEVGMSYLDVLNRLAEDHIDFVAAPAGRTLHVWRKGEGSLQSVTSAWTPGSNMLTREVQTVTRR